jgi:hypothetical protein
MMTPSCHWLGVKGRSHCSSMQGERCGRRIDGESDNDDLSRSVEPIPMTLSVDECDELLERGCSSKPKP